MSSRNQVVAQYHTLSPVNTHDYWKELCSKEDLRRDHFDQLKKGRSYNIYNGYGRSGEKRETTMKSLEKGKFIDFSRIGRLFVVPSHKTAVHSFNTEAVDKNYLLRKEERDGLKKAMDRALLKKSYEKFDVKTYRKQHRSASLQRNALELVRSPTRSELKIKKLQQKLKHERKMRELAENQLKRETSKQAL